MESDPGYCGILYDHYLRIDELYGKFAKAHGETYFSLWALEELGENGGTLTQKALTEKLHLPKQTVASIVASFERRDIAHSEQAPADRRSRLIKLTDGGWRRYRHVARKLHALENAALDGMDGRDIEHMNKTLKTLIDRIEQEMGREVNGGRHDGKQ